MSWSSSRHTDTEAALGALEESPQFLDRHVGVSENAAQRALGDIAARVYRHRRPATVRMAHDVMASGGPLDREPCLL